MHLTVHPQLTAPQKIVSLPMILYYGGGHGLRALLFSVFNVVAAVIAADVRAELQKQQAIFRLIQHCRTIALIESETANSILTKAYPNETAILSRIGNCSAQKGMGQRGGLGDLGIAPQLDSEEFSEILNWVRSRCIQDKSGILPGLTAGWMGSLAGGANSKSHLSSAAKFLRLGEELDLPMELDFQVTDSITYTGLGRNVHVNCAVALDALNRFVMTENQRPGSRAVVNARIATLPPVGNDQALRQELDLLDKQAWFSSELQDEMVMIGPNAALSSRFGNITHSSTDYFRSIPKRQVAGQIAAGYHEDIEEAMERVQPTPHLVNHFDARPVETPLVRPSINDLIDRLDSLDADGFMKGCEAKGSEIDYTITAFDIRDRQYDCERLSDHFTDSPETLSEAIDDLIVIETIRDLLVQEEADNKAELQEVNTQLKKQKPKCIRQFHHAQNPRWGAERKVQKLQELAEQYREYSDERREREVLAKDLDKCLRTASSTKDRKHAKLNELLRLLDHHRAKGKESRDAGLFYYRTVNEAFPLILQLDSCDDHLQRYILASQAIALTELGVQYILGATSSDANGLSEICVGPATVPGAWLAAIEREPHHTFVVFPPMSSALAESLRSAIATKAPKWRVIFADSCACGLNVVRIHLFYPRTEQECMPGFLATELRKVKESELRILHMPEEQDSTLPAGQSNSATASETTSKKKGSAQ